jgi:NitT/TauT family transport system permease protein
VAAELRETIPTFGKEAGAEEQGVGVGNLSSLTHPRVASTLGEVLLIILVAIVFIGTIELYVRLADVKSYVFPPPSEIGRAFFNGFDSFWPQLLVTLRELLVGFGFGASIGILLAAVITQFPLVEKLITPYVLLLVTTPMIALVPLLILQWGFGSTPRYVACGLAVFPMVMINSATGFRRTDLAKIALARSYGASTFQIFTKVRFPLALPMIIVGLMVGSIFGLLTTIGAEMLGGKGGVGRLLMTYYGLITMDLFWAVILLIALMGVAIYVIFYWIGKTWASWQA